MYNGSGSTLRVNEGLPPRGLALGFEAQSAAPLSSSCPARPLSTGHQQTILPLKKIPTRKFPKECKHRAVAVLGDQRFDKVVRAAVREVQERLVDWTHQGALRWCSHFMRIVGVRTAWHLRKKCAADTRSTNRAASKTGK